MFMLAAVLGLFAAWLANSWLTNRLALRDAAATVPQHSVVIAALEIKFGQAIEESHVRLLQLPETDAPPNTYKNVADVVGKVATQTILPGEFIVAGRLTDHEGGSTLAAVVPEGKRAVTVRVNDVIGVAGFLLPGNRVDVISSRNVGKRSESTTLLEAIKVLAVDQTASSDKNEPVIVRAITLELSPEQSERLVTATNEGSVQMALRNPLDETRIARTEVKPDPAPTPAPPPQEVVREVVKEVVKVVEKPVYRTPVRTSVTLIRGIDVAETKVD